MVPEPVSLQGQFSVKAYRILLSRTFHLRRNLMGFSEMLQDLVSNVRGGYAATIMGFDGIPIQDYKSAEHECDLESLGVEYGKILGEIRKAAEVLEIGKLEEVIIISLGMKFVVRVINPEYFVALVLLPNSNSGKGRYLLRKTASNVVRELGI